MPDMNHNNLTRKELAEAVVEHLGFSQSSCAEIVDSVLDTMKQTLLAGEAIKIVHFGTFSLRHKSPRNGRNPRTGDAITIKKRQTVSFRPSKQLREEINR
jgi:integration host factor subunit alpha